LRGGKRAIAATSILDRCASALSTKLMGQLQIVASLS
jgi:hypothetical protein